MLKNPVYFVHGLFIEGNTYNKLSCWPELAKNVGVDFFVHERPQEMLMQERADLLAESLNRSLLKNRKIHLVGHSAGGIDARLVLHKYPELADRVLSVTTVGTPHRGTPIADHWIKGDEADCPFVDFLFGVFKFAGPQANEMTTKFMQNFNDQVLPNEKVHYYSLPYFIHNILFAPLSVSGWKYLKRKGHGLNDGTVPFASQVYGQTIGDIQISKNLFGNHGDHKSETFPIRYGFKRINGDCLMKVFKNLKALENGLA